MLYYQHHYPIIQKMFYEIGSWEYQDYLFISVVLNPKSKAKTSNREKEVGAWQITTTTK